MSTDAVLRRLLNETEAPLAAAEVELHRLQERIRELQAERYGLQLALARRFEEPPEVAEPAAARPPPGKLPGNELRSEELWNVLSRAEAVERVLEAADRPLNRQEVVTMLEQAGRQGDTPDAVSAALAYLQRIDRATRAGRNQWTLLPYPAGT